VFFFHQIVAFCAEREHIASYGKALVYGPTCALWSFIPVFSVGNISGTYSEKTRSSEFSYMCTKECDVTKEEAVTLVSISRDERLESQYLVFTSTYISHNTVCF
jgi:hypothetical protein